MPNDSYSGANTVVLPILHQGGGDSGSGEASIHNVEVEKDTPVADLHAALLQNDYHLPVSDEAPSESLAEENTEKFRNAARDAWMSVGPGTKRAEAGFVDPGNRLQYPNQDDPAYGTHLKQAIGKKDFAALHTHPNANGGQPSQQDIVDAKKVGKPYYVVSKEGLFMVRPSDGAVVKVFDGTGWMREKKQRPQ